VIVARIDFQEHRAGVDRVVVLHGDVDNGAADACGDLEEVKPAVRVGFEKFGVGYAANGSETFDHLAVDIQ